MTAYTIQLSQGVYHRLKMVAAERNQPIDRVLQDVFRPSLDGIPEQFRADLEALTWLSDDELWEVARYKRPIDHTEQHHALLRANANRTLTASEQKQLVQFQEESDHTLLRISRAYLLLKQRGHLIPNPYDPTSYD